MTLRTKLLGGAPVAHGPKSVAKGIEGAPNVEAPRVATSDVEASKTGGAPDVARPTDRMETNAGALSAARSISLSTKAATTSRNRGAEGATLGTRLMSFAGSGAVAKAAAAIALGVSLLGMAQPASADVVQIGKSHGTPVEQAAQKIADEAGEPYVLVGASKAALAKIFQQANDGEMEIRHLILDIGHGKLPAAAEWQKLQQQFPAAFDQVQVVHVIGQKLKGHPFDAWKGELFPNASAVVTFSLSKNVKHGPASAWLIEQTTASIAGMDPGASLSPHEAQIQAKAIATSAALPGVGVRVDVGKQSFIPGPDNGAAAGLSSWLGAKAANGSLTRAVLQKKLKELGSLPKGFSAGMLADLAQRVAKLGPFVDYDAARLTAHLADIERVAGTKLALKALQDGNVDQVRHELATKANGAHYAKERSNLFAKEVPRGLPLDGDAAIPTGGIQGAPYLVDGLGTVRNGEVNIQAIRHPKNGDGYQLTFKLGDEAGYRLEKFMNAGGATLIDKTIMNQAPVDGRVVTIEKTDAVQATATVENQPPEMSVGPALRLEKADAYRLDYFAESISKQSLRGEVQLQVYGKSDAERNQRLRDVLQELGLKDALGGKPSAETEQKMKALRLLEQADPRAHHALADRLDKGGDVTPAELHAALTAAEVPPAFVEQAYFAEGAPGHLSVIVPGQSEAYARRGVHALYHTMGNAETFAYIAADGALMSTKDRLQVGKVFRGMSSDEDLRTGGADFVFTRQVTTSTGNPDAQLMSGGAIIFKADVLDRADWFAYAGDNFGTTLSGDRGAPTEAVKEVARRTYERMKAAGKFAEQPYEFEPWFKAYVGQQLDQRENTYLPRPVGRHQVAKTEDTSNETMLEGTIPLSQMERFIVPNDQARERTLAKLKALGVNEINGTKVEDFVQVRKGRFFTDEEMLRFQNPVDAKPGDKTTNELKDPRLEFYVKNKPFQLPGVGAGETKTG